MFNSGYPTANIKWAADTSGANQDVLFAAQTDGLCVPFGFIMAERGEPGRIYFGSAADLYPVLGSYSFDETSPYFSPASRFMATAMAGQAVNVMRLVDPTATKATMGLFLEVTTTILTQYQKDSSGKRVVDENGSFIPVAGQFGGNVQEPGLHLKWVYRPLSGTEKFNTLTTTTVVDDKGVSKTVYPIYAHEVSSPGKYGNRQGISLYSSGSELAQIANSIGSILYRFIPYELPTGVSTTAQPIVDVLGNAGIDGSFKDVAVYQATATNYAFKYLLNNNYVDDQGENTLPFNAFTYGANVQAIGQAILGVSPELAGTDPYLIDLVSGKDLNDNYYDHVDVDVASLQVVNESQVIYSSGGTDGTVSFAKLQELMIDFLNASDWGEFENLMQHPMTHYTDPGLAINTKYALFNMLDHRDNFKIDVSTQDVSLAPNTKAQDISAGQALFFRSQMHPNNAITGVGCSRVSIFAHTADLVAGTAYTGKVPFTLNRLIQRRDLAGGTYIKGSIGGQPNSNVTIFKKPNWVADADKDRKLAWANAINTVSHADRVTIFYPAVRTVYPNDTSLLVDDEFADNVTYAFKLVRKMWARYAGVKAPSKKLFSRIQRDIDNVCAEAFNSDSFSVKSTVFTTAYDQNLGYQTSVNLAITGVAAQRVWEVNVTVGRSVA